MKPRWPVLLLLSVMFLLLATATFAQDTTSTHVTIAIAGEGQVFADGVEVGAGTIALPLGETTFSLVPEYGWLVDKVIWRYSADEEWVKVYDVSDVTIDVAPGLDIGVVFEKEEVVCVPGTGDHGDFYVSVWGKGEVRFLDIIVTEDNYDDGLDCTPFGAEILFDAIPSTGWQLNKIVWEYDDMQGAPGWTGETTASSIALAYDYEMRLYAYFVQTAADVKIAITGEGDLFADGVEVQSGTTLLPLGETTFTLESEYGWLIDKVIWRYSADEEWMKVYNVSEVTIDVAPGLDIGVVFEKEEVTCVPGDGSVDDFYVSVSGKGEVRFLDIVATEDNSDEDYDCAPFGAEILFEAIPSTGWQLNKIVWEYDDMEGAPGWYGETTASSIALAYHSEMRLYAYFVQTSADVTVSITGDGNFFADGVKVKPGTTLLPLGETTFTLAPEDGWQVDKILWRYGETQPWTKVYGVSEIKLIVASDLEIGVVFEKTASQSTPTFTPTVTPTQRTIPAKTNTATATATSTLSPPNSTYTSTPTPSPTNTQVDTSTPTPTARPTSESIPTPGSNVISLPMILGAESGGSSVPAPTRE